MSTINFVEKNTVVKMVEPNKKKLLLLLGLIRLIIKKVNPHITGGIEHNTSNVWVNKPAVG